MNAKNSPWRPWTHLAICLLATQLLGCAGHKQYRTDYRPCVTGADCRSAAIEETEDYVLGYVELDDQGWFWDRKQLDAVENKLIEESTKHGLLLTVFVHGWKHNASAGDGNVVMFRRVLRGLRAMEKDASRRERRPERRVAGVYVGWRGLSQNLPVLKNLTFWERKNTAEQVGHSAVTELLAKLETLRNADNVLHAGDRKASRLVIVGHSFGGAAVYSSVGQILIERLAELVDRRGRAEQPGSVGDLVVLINPAFEASRYAVLRSVAASRSFLTNQPLALTIFTSETDNATKIAFPIGRRLTTVTQKYQSAEQHRADVTAVGHYQPFVTHRLVPTQEKKPSVDTVEAVREKTIEQSVDKVIALKAQLRQNARNREATRQDLTFTFTGVELRPNNNYKRFNPLFVVTVDKRIIPNHNDIDGELFIRFLREFVLTFTPDDSSW